MHSIGKVFHPLECNVRYILLTAELPIYLLVGPVGDVHPYFIPLICCGVLHVLIHWNSQLVVSSLIVRVLGYMAYSSG